MEALLSLSFNNISSKDGIKIRKGLKQIEGVLAQICLGRPAVPSSRRRASAILDGEQGSAQKSLGALVEDPAFRDFFRLQEGFEWNVATHLVGCLERLLGLGGSDENDLLIICALNVLQGILLLHPPSRCLFGREIYMNLLLDLLDPYNCPAIQSAALLVLVSALLANPQNIRTFENIDGLLTVTSLFKSRSTSQSVKLKLIEFLYFYLLPETPTIAATSAPNTAVGGIAGLNRSPSKLLSAFERRTMHIGADGTDIPREEPTRTTDEKQRLLGKYLSNVEDLVQDLKDSAPFEEVAM